MSTPAALTHHAILALVEPLSRVGRKIDLAASDRLQGHLAFQPIERAPADGLPALVERLDLDCPARARYRLTRRLVLGDGTTATLEVDGTSILTMLRVLSTIGPARQLAAGEGYVAARHDRVYASAGVETPPRLLPVGATVRLGATVLQFDFPGAPGLAAEVRIAAPSDVHAQMNDDVLALLGWDWSMLCERDGARRASVRMRGRDLDRAATRVLHQAARHLARLFADGPRRFGERFALRRLGVVWRRAIPLTAFAVMGLEVLFADALRGARDSVLVTALVALPLLTLAFYFFRCQEPRFEVLRWRR